MMSSLGGHLETEHHDDHAHHDHRADQAALGLKTAILIGLGMYFVYLIVTGNLTNYINERFVWLSYVAAAIFLLLGVYSLILMVRAFKDHNVLHEALGHSHDGHEDHQHGISWSTLAVIAVPLILGTLIPSRPLGAEAVNGALSTSASVGEMVTFTKQPLDRNVLDWLRYFGSLPDYAEANGQPADVIGFVYREPTFPENHFMLARFTVSCCVADAAAIGLPTLYAESIEQGVWVRVQGSFTVGEFRGDTMPILQASSLEIVEQPEHPYLYP